MTEKYKERIKYSRGAAESYSRREPDKHRSEMELIEKGLKFTSGIKTILDAPCGVGRASVLLAQKGYAVTAVDLGNGALEFTRDALTQANVPGTVLKDDIEHMQFSDGAFDAVLCFRLFHHFPNVGVKERVAKELCRVAKDYVLISYISPWSFTTVRRRVKLALFNKPLKQHHTSLRELTGYFAAHGFSLVEDIPQQRYVHSLHLAVFKRIDSK